MRHDPAVLRTRAAVRAALAPLPRGVVVLVAVSGGADSLALAAATAHEAGRAAIAAGAVIVDHGLQDASAERAGEAAAACRRLALDPVVVRRVRVGRRGGPEAAARTARYAALDAVAQEAGAREAGAAFVLLGHTQDDQAETVLLGLARGSGARSLAGMAATGERYLRPFLGLRRADTAAACAALGLRPWDDPHNTDRSFTRARVRHDALPALEDAIGAGAVPALARTADRLRADADALDEWAGKQLPELTTRDGLDVTGLAALPAAVRTRVLRRAAVLAGVPDGALSSRHVLALDRLVTGPRGRGPVSLPGGLVAERRCDRLTLR